MRNKKQIHLLKIKLTESLAAPLVESTKKQYEQKLAQKETEIHKRESMLHEQLEQVSKDRESIGEQVSLRLNKECERIRLEEARRAHTTFSIDLEQKTKEISELNEVLKERDTKLADAQKAQAEITRKERELDDAKREVELTVQKKVKENLSDIRNKATKDAFDEFNLKLAEKNHTITSMQRQIEELKRRAEQESQQLQGEVQELELENILRTKFPRDEIIPVPKGEHGGDILHYVTNHNGQRCGAILWESKRTKNWSDAWLTKLREDQRVAKAEIAVMISHTLPKSVEAFGLIGGVWVSEPRCAIPVAITLRHFLIDVAATRQASEGQQTKMEMVYQYLTGTRFRQKVQAIVEKFTDMKDDLDRERKFMSKNWAKREEQINLVIATTAGMYGDLQGIAGKSLQEIEGLDVKMIPDNQSRS
ncbi:hypothetical protein RFI_31310 [Reticulomyxa filosa]|uniref:DUF2130 domain-containing protein n=1 Tax=Reticulomyxa filosa TaxID=46433 RepID=X6LXJ0_RETFI|nr:hypothetical protein RFI_31310 [Reticulomyxa filosa]|eukprot:ETO06086.1 hypothetical protein RFI_31310 [Reticulomyxa filosa]